MAKKKKKQSSSTAGRALGMGCLVLFALPFAAAGTFVMYLAVAQAVDYSRAAEWPKQDAKLLAAKLESRTNDGSTTYEATARYEYHIAGQRYESEQVAFSGAADNIGTYQRDKGRELERQFAAGGQIACYVNPDDPNEAVLFRDWRLGMLAVELVFGLTFALIGYGLIAGAWFGGRKLKHEAAARAARPDEPWTWRDQWADGRIESTTHHKAIAATAFAVLWNLISWPAIIGVMLKEDREWWLPLLVGIFPVVGVAMALYAVKLWRGHLRWGRSVFEMAAVPGVLGGRVAGVIHAPPAIDAPKGFLVSLSCIRKEEHGSGEDSRTVDHVLWSDERLLAEPLTADAATTVLPVQFHAPYQQPATNFEDVLWKLAVRAETAGVDYEAEFEIPVFKTADSSPDDPPGSGKADPLAAYEAPLTTAMIAQRIGARLEYEGPDETSLYFPMAHNRGMTAFLTLFSIAWTGISVGLFYSEAPRIFPWVFSAFAVLIDAIALQMLFSSTRLKFGPRGVTSHRRWLMFGRPRDLAAEEIKAVRSEFSGTTSGSTRFERIVLRTASQETVKLTGNLASQTAAKKLAGLIRAAIGLSDDATEAKVDRKPRRSPMPLESELPDELQ